MNTTIIKDKFGPEYVIHAYDPVSGMTGFLVIDNTAFGPGKGGIRMTPDVTVQEVFRLARTMTWKNAMAGIPFGGAKAGLVAGWKSDEEKKIHVQKFAEALKPFIVSKYVAGPDVNSGEREMQWFAEAIGDWRAATGKPKDYCTTINGKKACGLPHELGSTGFGVARATKAAAEMFGIQLEGATVAIEGFGNVGTFAFKHLREMGAKIVAVSDSRGTVYGEEGLDEKILHDLKANRKSVTDYPGAKALPKEGLFELPVDILIPAAVTDVINETNKDKIKAKMIVEGANIPMKENIENELWEKGIIIVPDFVANAGGVISSYAEYIGCAPEEMFKMVEERVESATREVMSRSIKEKKNPRAVGLALAEEKVLAKMNKR